MNRKHLIAAALLSLGLAGAAHAQQGVNLSTGFTDFTTWTVLGTATAQNMTPGNGFMYSELVLTTPGSEGSSGAGFAPTALVMDLNQAFHFDFNFFIAGSELRGDGLTFTLARAPGGGGTGSGLGYGGLDHSVAFAVDTFNFDGEPISPSIQILQNGSTDPLAVTETGVGDVIRNVPFQSYATVDYTPSGNNDAMGTLSGFLKVYTAEGDPDSFLSFTVSAQVDLNTLLGDGQTADSAMVYYGFTGANGAAQDGHFITSAVPVPEPAPALLLLAGLACLGYVAGRKRAN